MHSTWRPDQARAWQKANRDKCALATRRRWQRYRERKANQFPTLNPASAHEVITRPLSAVEPGPAAVPIPGLGLTKSGPNPTAAPVPKEASLSVPAAKAMVCGAPQQGQYPSPWIQKKVYINGVKVLGFVNMSGVAPCQFFWGPGGTRVWKPFATPPTPAPPSQKPAAVPTGSAPAKRLILGADGRLHQV